MVRAILSPAKIILVDEATANVDAATDLQVQKVTVLRTLNVWWRYATLFNLLFFGNDTDIRS